MLPMSLEHIAHLLGGTLHGNGAGQVSCVALDSRQVEPGALFIALRGERVDGHQFAAAAAARGALGMLGRHAQPELPSIVVADPIAALAELGRHCRQQSTACVLALTGSNGKTTVKELLAAMLSYQAPTLATRGNLNNHLGVPLTLTRLRPEHRYAVIELGANHLGEIASLAQLVTPQVGLVTNAAPAHLEGFGSMDGVAHAKGELVASLGDDATAIINLDDIYAPLWLDKAQGAGKILTFGASSDQPDSSDSSAPPAPSAPPDSSNYSASSGSLSTSGSSDSRGSSATAKADVRYRNQGHDLELFLQGRWYAMPTSLLGRHNAANAAAAAAGARALGAPAAAIAAALAQARPPRGRLQPLPGMHCRTVIDDSYNANPSSLGAALAVLNQMGGEKWLLLGDMAELGGDSPGWHRSAAEQARKMGVEHLWALGSQAALAAEAFGAGGRTFAAVESLVSACHEELSEDAVVLIKGSRSAGMERLVAALADQSATLAEGS